MQTLMSVMLALTIVIRCVPTLRGALSVPASQATSQELIFQTYVKVRMNYLAQIHIVIIVSFVCVCVWGGGGGGGGGWQ